MPVRPLLPNDDRSWAQAKFDKYPVPEEVALLTLATLRDDDLIILGNAFVIADFGDRAICLGAAHSFEMVKRLQQDRSIQSHPTMPKDFVANVTKYIKTDGIFAVHMSFDSAT